MQKTYVSQYFIQYRAIDTDERQNLLDSWSLRVPVESYNEILEPYLHVLSHSYFRSVPFTFALLLEIESCRKKDLASVTVVFEVFGLPPH